MKYKKIELNILTFVLLEAFFLLFFFKISFLNIILGTILGIIFTILTKKIKSNKFMDAILLIISLLSIIIILKNITQFLTENILANYPSIIITITFFIVSLFVASKGYHTYIKSLEITFYFYLFVKLASVILILPNINIKNFNFQLLEQFNINYSFLYVSLTILFISLSIKYLTDYYVKISTISISIINPIIMKLISISIIGNTLFNLYKYPYFSILKRIKYLDFIERMEGILSFEYFVIFIFLTSFLILLIQISLKNLLVKKKIIHS